MAKTTIEMLRANQKTNPEQSLNSALNPQYQPCQYIIPTQPFENLALGGNGTFDLASVGALEVLQQNGLLGGIERVAGSSIGGVLAALMALGYSVDEIKYEAERFYADYILSDKSYRRLVGATTSSDKYGLYKSEKLLQWAQELVAIKLGDPNATFSDLDRAKKLDPNFKELTIVATCLNRHPVEQNFNAEETPDLPIAEAIRISCAIPKLITPVKMPDPLAPDKTAYFVSGIISNPYPMDVFINKNNRVQKGWTGEETLGIYVDTQQNIDAIIWNFKQEVKSMQDLNHVVVYWRELIKSMHSNTKQIIDNFAVNSITVPAISTNQEKLLSLEQQRTQWEISAQHAQNWLSQHADQVKTIKNYAQFTERDNMFLANALSGEIPNWFANLFSHSCKKQKSKLAKLRQSYDQETCLEITKNLFNRFTSREKRNFYLFKKYQDMLTGRHYGTTLHPEKVVQQLQDLNIALQEAQAKNASKKTICKLQDEARVITQCLNWFASETGIAINMNPVPSALATREISEILPSIYEKYNDNPSASGEKSEWVQLLFQLRLLEVMLQTISEQLPKRFVNGIFEYLWLIDPKIIGLQKTSEKLKTNKLLAAVRQIKQEIIQQWNSSELMLDEIIGNTERAIDKFHSLLAKNEFLNELVQQELITKLELQGVHAADLLNVKNLVQGKRNSTVHYAVKNDLYEYGTNLPISPNYQANNWVHQSGPIRKLVLEGGGVKGLAYVGALEQLQMTQHLDQINAVAGSSAGGIVATLMALGMDPLTMKKIMLDMNFAEYLDVDSDTYWDPRSYRPWHLSDHSKLAKVVLKLTGFTVEGRSMGVWQGDAFLEWGRQMVEQIIGNPDATFRDLKEAQAVNPMLKDLVLTGTCISREPREQYFSFSNTPDLPIAVALRITMSFPGAFCPVEIQDPLNPDKTAVFIDGGAANNYPVEIFDNVNAFHQDCYNSNEILGLRVDDDEEIDRLKWNQRSDDRNELTVNSAFEYTKSVIDAAYNKDDKKVKSDYAFNTIQIPNMQIDTLDLHINMKQKQDLLAAGQYTMQKWLEIYRDSILEIENFKDLPEKYSRLVNGDETHSPVAVQNLQQIKQNLLLTRSLLLQKKRNSNEEQQLRLVDSEINALNQSIDEYNKSSVINLSLSDYLLPETLIISQQLIEKWIQQSIDKINVAYKYLETGFQVASLADLETQSIKTKRDFVFCQQELELKHNLHKLRDEAKFDQVKNLLMQQLQRLKPIVINEKVVSLGLHSEGYQQKFQQEFEALQKWCQNLPYSESTYHQAMVVFSHSAYSLNNLQQGTNLTQESNVLTILEKQHMQHSAIGKMEQQMRMDSVHPDSFAIQPPKPVDSISYIDPLIEDGLSKVAAEYYTNDGYKQEEPNINQLKQVKLN